MQLILDIEDNQQDIVLNIIKNLKEGIIKSYSIPFTQRADIKHVSPEEEQEIVEILNNMTPQDREISDVRQYSIEL